MKKYFFIFFLIVSCSYQQNFDKQLWQYQDSMRIYPNRESMLKDLLDNYKLTGQRYKTVTNILGEPEWSEKDSMIYNIVTDYGWDIDPVYKKDLIIYFNKDSVTTGFKIREWKN